MGRYIVTGVGVNSFHGKTMMGKFQKKKKLLIIKIKMLSK